MNITSFWGIYHGSFYGPNQILRHVVLVYYLSCFLGTLSTRVELWLCYITWPSLIFLNSWDIKARLGRKIAQARNLETVKPNGSLIGDHMTPYAICDSLFSPTVATHIHILFVWLGKPSQPSFEIQKISTAGPDLFWQFPQAWPYIGLGPTFFKMHGPLATVQRML